MVKTKIKFICTHKPQSGKNQGRWSLEEQDRFLKGCYLYKNNWKKIQEYIKTRTIPQIRSHAQKYLIRLCGKYSIKLSKKKFALSNSNQDIVTVPCKKRLSISKMNIYEKNIFEMFNYYNREIISEENENKKEINDLNKINHVPNLNNSLNFINNNLNINQEIILNENIQNSRDRLINDIINLLLLKQKIQLENYEINNNFPYFNRNNYDNLKNNNLDLLNNNSISYDVNNLYHTFNNYVCQPNCFSNGIIYNRYNNYNNSNNMNYYNRNTYNNILNNLLINKPLNSKNINNYNNSNNNENLNQIYNHNNNCIQNQYNNILLSSSKNPLEINNYSRAQIYQNNINNNKSNLVSSQSNQSNNDQNDNNDISFYEYANNYCRASANKKIINRSIGVFNKSKERYSTQFNKLEDFDNKHNNRNKEKNHVY